MYHTVYKTVNTINGHYYIGKHSTNNINDDYLGSGKILINAVNKYGNDVFEKHIIAIFDNEQDAYNFEHQYLLEHLDKKECYNIVEGGRGWTAEEAKKASLKSKNSEKWKIYIESDKHKEMASIAGKEGAKINKENQTGMFSFTYEQRSIWSSENNGDRMWITDGVEDKRILSDENIPDGWYNGRTCMGDNPNYRNGMKCWTNGTIHIFSEVSPGPDFRNGMIKETPTAKMNWWNNGVINKRSFTKPGDDFMPGKVYKESQVVECPHCGAKGGAPAMGRHHFDNCKLKDNING
jgi:hypothetical protein